MRKIYLSRENRMVAGVLGGIGEAFNTDPLVLRLLWIFLTLVTGIFAGVIVYIIAWMVIPEKLNHKVKDDAWSSE